MADVMSCPKSTEDLIFERVVAWGQDEAVAARYPNHVHFVAADDPGLGGYVSEALGDGDPVVLVFPSGDEVLIEPGGNGAPPRLQVRDSAGNPLSA